MIHGTLDKEAYEEGDRDEKQHHWFGQWLHLYEDYDNPTCWKPSGLYIT